MNESICRLLASCLSPLAAAWFISISASPTSAQTDEPQRYRDPVLAGGQQQVTRDIVYGRSVDLPSGEEVDLLLDLYEIEGDEEPERGVFVFIHGGGFRNGDKSRGRNYAASLIEYGYVTASISYRLNQGSDFDLRIGTAVEDARKAVAWLQANAAEHRLDPERILIGGSSAGAITALFLAYTDISTDDPDADPGVVGVVDWWGGLYNQVDQLEAGEAPLAIIHGTEDRTVPFAEAVKLRDRAEAGGLPHAYWPIEGGGHAAHDVPRDVPRVAEFFYPLIWEAATSPNPSPSPPPAEPTPVPPTTEPPSTGSRLYLPRCDTGR